MHSVEKPTQWPVFTAEQVRRIEVAAMAQGTTGEVLMKRAGREAYRLARELWPSARRLVVVCGAGNNAGDGWIVAALALANAYPVELLFIKPPEQLSAEAAAAAAYALREGLQPKVFSADFVLDNAREYVVVDALLGTGLKGAPSQAYAQAIAWCNTQNQLGAKTLAIDVPSGLCADTGAAVGAVIRADATLTFIGRKRGLYTADAPLYCGSIFFAHLNVADSIVSAEYGLSERGSVAVMASAPRALVARQAVCHKGDFGHVAVLGGAQGMCGAALLAADTCLHAGAGLVSVFSQKATVQAARVRLPEVMAVNIDDLHELESRLMAASVVLVGPGLSQTDWALSVLRKALASAKPTVLDADALNLCARDHLPLDGSQRPIIMTPHPAEAARLLACTTVEVQANRFDAAGELSRRYHAVVVLKGAGSLIAENGRVWICPVACPALAIGGAGDVLAGVIAALLAQGMSPSAAAKLGVWVHAQAGQQFVEECGNIGLLAGQLPAIIRTKLNEL